MSFRFAFFVVILCCFFASCEKVVEVDFDDNKHVMVLNAVPSEGSQLFVNFAYSRFFLDTNIVHPVAGANISIDVNGTRLTPSQVVKCNYFFPYTLQADDQLRLSISANGQTITADTYVPRPPQISSVEAHIDTFQALTLLNIDFDLADHANYRDLYHFSIICRDSGRRHNPYTEEIDQVDTVTNEMFLCFDQAITSSAVSVSKPLAGYFYNRLMTIDSLIDGQNHHVRLMVVMLKDTNEIEPYRHYYTLDVETVTPDRYKYLQDVNKATSMMMLFTDPIPIYTNVKGAYGIFAGNARRQFALNPDTLAAPMAVSLPPAPEMQAMLRSARLNR